MGFWHDIFGTSRAQDEQEISTENFDNDTERAQEHDFKDKNLECERYILDEQDREGRLLPLVSKALRNIYGDKTVKRCLRRLYMRRHREHCSNKAKYEQIEKIGKAFFGKDKDDKDKDGNIFANNTL